MPKLPKLKMPKLPKIKLPDPGQLLNQLAEGAKDLMSNLGPGGGMSEDYPEEEENLEDEYSEDGYEDEYSEEGYEDEYSEEGYEDEYSEEGYEDEYFEEVEDFGTYNTDTEQAYLLRGDDPETLDGFFDWLFGRKKTTSEEIKDFNKTNIVGDVCEKDLLGFDFSSILNMGTNMMNASPQNRTDMANSAIGTGLNAFLPGAGSVFQQGMGIYNQAQRNKRAKKKAEAEKRKKTLLALLNKNKKPSPKPRKKIKRPTPRPIPKKNLQTVSNYPPPPTQYMASNQKNNTALIVGGVGVGAVALILLMNNKPRGRR
ncbi:MAG: hypothetical protein KDK36_04485 [Leptospiraceae bacterium]|nr:hypothetical protein [Leptospiraceae bacterium]